MRTPTERIPVYRHSQIVLTKINSTPASYQPETLGRSSHDPSPVGPRPLLGLPQSAADAPCLLLSRVPKKGSQIPKEPRLRGDAYTSYATSRKQP